MQKAAQKEVPKIFADVKEMEITRAIANEFHSVLVDGADSDVIIIGAGPAGLKFFNLTKFDDLVLKNRRVGGVVVNWMPVSALPRNITCVDPVALESKMVIDASGHDSVAVKRLVDRKLVEWKGMDPMWVDDGENRVVYNTGEVFPGLVLAGMSVTETYGIARMGPTYGSMLLSG